MDGMVILYVICLFLAEILSPLDILFWWPDEFDLGLLERLLAYLIICLRKLLENIIC